MPTHRVNHLINKVNISFFCQSWETDNNLDGKYDSLDFNIKIPLADSEAIHSVQLVLIFDYQLHVSGTVQAILNIIICTYYLLSHLLS